MTNANIYIHTFAGISCEIRTKYETECTQQGVLYALAMLRSAKQTIVLSQQVAYSKENEIVISMIRRRGR
jgi:hypothetical protein